MYARKQKKKLNYKIKILPQSAMSRCVAMVTPAREQIVDLDMKTIRKESKLMRNIPAYDKNIHVYLFETI